MNNPEPPERAFKCQCCKASFLHPQTAKWRNGLITLGVAVFYASVAHNTYYSREPWPQWLSFLCLLIAGGHALIAFAQLLVAGFREPCCPECHSSNISRP